MNFTDFALILSQEIEQEQFQLFSKQPNIIQIVSQTKAALIQNYIPEFIQTKYDLRLLQNKEEIFAACVIVYYYSVDVSLDMLENSDLYKFSLLLCKLLFQQQKAELPLSLYSAFTVITLKHLECLEMKKLDDLILLNQTIKEINFNYANNGIESVKLINNLMRDMLARFYSTINQTTIEYCIQFLVLQKDYYKLIELFSLRFYSKAGRVELKIADLAYQQFYDYINSKTMENTKMNDSVSEANSHISEQDPDSLQEMIQNFTHYLLTQIAVSGNNIQLAVKKYFISFIVLTQLQDVHNLINALLVQKLSNYKVLAVVIADQLIQYQFFNISIISDNPITTERNQLSYKQILSIIKGLVIQVMSEDEEYFQQLLSFQKLVLSQQTNVFCHADLIRQVLQFSDQNQDTQQNEYQQNQNVHIDLLTQNTNLMTIKPVLQKQLFVIVISVLVLQPILFYICMLKLSTHNGFVFSQIQGRKSIIQYYGSILQNQLFMETTELILLNQDLTQSQQPIEIDKLIQCIHKKYIPDLQLIYRQFYQENTLIDNQNIVQILQQLPEKIKQLLNRQICLKNFLLQEILFRLQDESQQVKKLSAESLLTYIKQTDYQLVSLIFTDLLQMQSQETLMHQIFDQYVLNVLLENQSEAASKLLNLIENSPLKLFESAFAQFLKDLNIEYTIVQNLVSFNNIGSLKVLYYIIQYTANSSWRTKKHLKNIIDILIEKADLNRIDIENPKNKLKNIYIINLFQTDLLFEIIKSNDQLLQLYYFYVQDIQTGSLQINSDEAEILNKINASILIYKLDQNKDDIEKTIQGFSKQIQNFIEITMTNNDYESLNFIQNQNQEQLQQIQQLLLSCSYLAQANLLSQKQFDELSLHVSGLLNFHPFASYAIIFLIYACNDVERRISLFENLIYVLDNQQNVTIVNNTIIAVLSSIYAFPDELGQFINMILDNNVLKTNYLIQRHFLYIIVDLEKLNLIKLNQEIFIQLFMYLISPNQDLQALAERLLLNNLQYQQHFVQNFIKCIELLNDEKIDVIQKASLYSKVLSKLQQTSKYQLLNVLLEKAGKLLSSPKIENYKFYFSDLMGILQSGAVEVTIQEEWQKADKILRKLNVQYSVSSVLPRLFECLAVFNSLQQEDLQHKTTMAIRAICAQMRVSYQDLVVQFGETYMQELVQIK